MASPNTRVSPDNQLGISISDALGAAGVLGSQNPTADERTDAVVAKTNMDWLEGKYRMRDSASFTGVGSLTTEVSSVLKLSGMQGRILRDIAMVGLDHKPGNAESLLGLNGDWRQTGIRQDVAAGIRARVMGIERQKLRRGPQLLPTGSIIRDLDAVEKTRMETFQEDMMQNSRHPGQRRVQNR